MLLSMMRKQAKSWLIKFLIGIISLVFIFYFGYSFSSRKGLKIAYVNGELISGMEYKKEYHDLVEGLRRQYKQIWNDNLIKVFDLKNKALEGLINKKLISREAKKLGLDVTESEVQKAIMDYPAFQVNGRFHMGRYQALLSNNRMKPEDFEASMAQQLLDGKVKQFLFSFMEVTDREVLDHYTFANEKVKISFVRFKPDDYKKSIKPDQASMEEFFKKDREGYRVPEKIKIAWLELDPKAFREQVKIGDKEIVSYYEYRMDTFREPRKVKASHILFKLKEGATEAKEKEVRDIAKGVLLEARQGKDFAGLARKYSEGPTKSNGGDLGYFEAGKMDKTFEDAAFKLKKGEISDLVRTRFGYHIIKVEDIKEARTKPLEEVRDQIVEDLITNASIELANEKGLSLIDQMPYDADLSKYAAEHDLKVQYTGYFSRNEPIDGIGGTDTLRQSLFALEGKETSDLMELEGKFYLFQVVDRKASYVPELNEVAIKVKEALIKDLAAKKAKAAADNFLADLNEGKSWNELAKQEKKKAEETDFFSRRDPVPKLGNVQGLAEAVFALNQDKKYPDTIFENDLGAYVIRWEASKGIDETEYLQEKEKYRMSLMQVKHNTAFENWLQDLRRNAEIEIVTPVTER
ncbi:MAG: SurA N-terminal domain-containing protein [Deltaproteobacteria bacterium]|nr:SurA N-terminal domain-containing protein [Deltaproteobacteria bacterium]